MVGAVSNNTDKIARNTEMIKEYHGKKNYETLEKYLNQKGGFKCYQYIVPIF
jgi:hypothetical protein